jgi:Putative 3TM holin, Phage_holin_3
MNTALVLITLSAYLVSVMSILAYRHEGGGRRRPLSWLSWLLLVAAGGSAIDLAVNVKPVDIFDAARAALLGAFVYGSKGDVSRLLGRE